MGNKITLIWKKKKRYFRVQSANNYTMEPKDILYCPLKQPRKSPPQIRRLLIAFIILENKPTLFESVNTNQDWETNL